jgi:O-succinylbenzoic acid--CoA ligase
VLVEAWLPRAAARRPDGEALSTPGGSRSYLQLLHAAARGAGELYRRGVRPGDRVALELAPGLDFACALHAGMLLGAVAVPVDLRLSAGERDGIAEGCVTRVQEPLLAGGRELSDGSLERDVARFAEGARHELDAPAVVIHTSGTTSSPRPIELSYGNLLWSALGSAVALGLDPDERWLCTLPVSHVGGLSILVRSAIYATTAVVHERFDTERVLRALGEEEITLVSVVATTLARLLDAGLSDPPRLRCALTGGGPVPAALVERARAAGVAVSLTYGLTEASSQVTTTPAPEARGSGLAAGAPLFCTKVGIESSEELAPGVGEILVRGPTVARSGLAPDGWLHTGDLGSLDEHGRLTVTGRRSETIVSGGENVSPVEVEAALESHPQVLEAAVLGVPDAEWGEAVTALVVPRAGESVAAEALRAHCALTLAPYKVPKRVTLVAGPLPRTPSGKLLRRELKQREQ